MHTRMEGEEKYVENIEEGPSGVWETDSQPTLLGSFYWTFHI